MGTPYARWIFYCAVTAVCLMFGGGSDLTLHPHDYSTNLWWQLMNRTAHEENKVNCCVCAQLPIATHNSGLHPGSITDGKQVCLYGLCTQLRLSVPRPKGCKCCKKDYSVLLRTGDAAKGLLGSMNCSFKADVLQFPQTAWKIPETISLAGAKPGSLRSCVFNNGHISLGMLPWNLCNKVYTYCEKTPDYINCIACRGQRATPGCKVWKDNPDCDSLLQERSFNNRLINSTHQLTNSTMRELTELRNMVLQNRVVLDLLTASQGGVCKIIGPA